eukprot:10959346-Alexandrium_andersonii.AAC.1
MPRFTVHLFLTMFAGIGPTLWARAPCYQQCPGMDHQEGRSSLQTLLKWTFGDARRLASIIRHAGSTALHSGMSRGHRRPGTSHRERGSGVRRVTRSAVPWHRSSGARLRGPARRA